MKDNIITVLVYTFNHENYIEDAINSILSQSTTFPFHILVIDDSSTDGTASTLKKLKEKHPDQISLILNKKNLGQKKGSKGFIPNLKSRYIAVLDGDDYWSNNKKLQAQVDFLDNNEDYNACFHDMSIKVESNISEATVKDKSKSFYKSYSQIHNYAKIVYPEDIINRLVIPTSSLVCRTKKVKKAYSEITSLDTPFKVSYGWVLSMLIIKSSKFRYFNETWGVYRDHKDGVTKVYDNDEFVNPVIYYLKKMRTDSYYKNLKTYLYSSLAENTYYLISNSQNLSIFNKRLKALKIIYYRFMQGLYKVIDIYKE